MISCPVSLIQPTELADINLAVLSSSTVRDIRMHLADLASGLLYYVVVLLLPRARPYSRARVPNGESTHCMQVKDKILSVQHVRTSQSEKGVCFW
jgi:hypothetical protein